ncbi:ATP-binding protein [Actinosynnema sp. NPDC059335]|uniref:ATP-binding protein n=1 Tax=Actinosynnema sp. NPDC059335 TaxID=3346804 RepID=UPI00366C0ABF
MLGDLLALRDDDRDAVAAVVVAGTAGVGKTSLAVRWAHRARRRFPDGQLYVNLRGYDPGEPVTPDQALDRFLRALDVRHDAIPTDLEAKAALYRSLLAGRRMLIVLDNAATVSQVRPLLPGTAECLVVVTSRSRLSGLMSRDGARRLSLELLPEAESVELIRSVTADYRTGDDPGEIAELARLCARLPLALRIAAERAASRPHMPLSSLIQDLRDESGLWDALSTGDDDEAGAVRTVFAWSYRALPEAAARLFRLLGLHPGPDFGVPAVAALAGVSAADARHQLDALVGAHLLEQTAPDRYQFHDLLRAYAIDQVNTAESLEVRQACLKRLILWYLHTADAANAVMQTHTQRPSLDPLEAEVEVLAFTGHGAAVRWYEAEYDNLLAATNAAVRAGMDDLAWRLPVVAKSYGAANSSMRENERGMEVALAAARRVGDGSGQAMILSTLGGIAARQQRTVEAIEHHNAALEIRRRSGDREGEAISLANLGIVHLFRRDFDVAAEYFERVGTIHREAGERRRAAIPLYNLADARIGQGRFQEAVSAAREAVAIGRAIGDRYGESIAMAVLARAESASGRFDRALGSMHAALAIVRELKNVLLEGYDLVELGRMQLAVGDTAGALESYQRAAAIHRSLGDRSREAQALDGAGEVYQVLGRHEEAVDFHRRAVADLRPLGDAWQLGLALRHLGDALRRTGAIAEAHEAWEEALSLLSGFSDWLASTVRREVESALGR